MQESVIPEVTTIGHLKLLAAQDSIPGCASEWMQSPKKFLLSKPQILFNSHSLPMIKSYLLNSHMSYVLFQDYTNFFF